jgi:hypothetical protein
MNREEMLEAIRCLLALGKSSNEHEARAALAKAAELMARHNIDAATIGTPSGDWSDRELHRGRRSPAEGVFIGSILDPHFFVKSLRHRSKGEWIVLAFGRPADLDVAEYVWTFLLRTYRELYRRRRGLNRQDYYHGLTEGIIETILKDRRAAFAGDEAASRSLMVLEGQVVQAAFDHYGPIHKPRQTRPPQTLDAWAIGKIDGAGLKILPALRSAVPAPSIAAEN